MTRKLLLSFCMVSLIAAGVRGGDLVRGVRYKLSAGDLASGVAAVEDYRGAKGVDAEYLDAVGWLARGAELLRRPEVAKQYVAELRREIPGETQELLVPLGAAIEVEGRVRAAQNGRGDAIRFFENELAHATAPSLRSRINKNIHLLSLEGKEAPPLTPTDTIGTAPTLESLHGKPVLLFFWAAGCGDCKAQAPSLMRVWQKYESRGLAMVTATRLYGEEKPEEEKANIEKAWREIYPALNNVPVVIDTETMVRYGASATPTFALIDRKGIVRVYAPTRLSEADLAKRIDELLQER